MSDSRQYSQQNVKGDGPKQAARQIYTDDGWQGTIPAEGTRRRTIYLAIGGALTEFEKPEGSFESRASFSLKLADAVESALLQTTIDAEEGR